MKKNFQYGQRPDKFDYTPILPKYLDEFIDLPWSLAASIAVDRWLYWLTLEWEVRS